MDGMDGIGRRTHVSVVGSGQAGSQGERLAAEVGCSLARRGCVLVCGGLAGVMAAACRGAREAGGRTVAILPGDDPAAANPWADVVVATGLGNARNAVVVQSGDAVIALPGGWGTLSEVALARKAGRPVVGLQAWADVEGVVPAATPEEAVEKALALAGKRR